MTPNEMVNAYPEIIPIFMGIILLIGVIVVALALWGESASRIKIRNRLPFSSSPLSPGKKQSIFRTALSWVLYHIGDMVSYPMHWWDLGFLYPAYNRLMLWSADLDEAGKIWDHVEEE